MKFVVDGMLGGLARWLRMLGYDTRYDSKTQDNELLDIIAHDDMILLTRDEELFKRAQAKSLQCILVQGETEAERLRFLADKLQISLSIDMGETRCPECNGMLGKVSKSIVASLVPPASLGLYQEYWKCSECGKVYWIGSHWKQIQATLEKARQPFGRHQA